MQFFKLFHFFLFIFSTEYFSIINAQRINSLHIHVFHGKKPFVARRVTT